MKIRNEIDLSSSEEDKIVLNWLLDRYHWSSQWPFVASCVFEKKEKASWASIRVWFPTIEGRILYDHATICCKNKKKISAILTYMTNLSDRLDKLKKQDRP